jgi:hypothetical protein
MSGPCDRGNPCRAETGQPAQRGGSAGELTAGAENASSKGPTEADKGAGPFVGRSRGVQGRWPAKGQARLSPGGFVRADAS